MKKLYILLFTFLITAVSFGQDMVITGAFDGPLTGGTPKVIELYVIADIPDLTTYGVGSANNGGGTDGEELTFSGSATAGDFIYITDNGADFTTYFGLTANYTNSVAGINGDDALELFSGGVVIDTFGDIGMDGTGTAWDHLDGWAYRNNSTGPDGTTFTIGSWSFSGTNATDGCTTNATCSSMFPIGTFTYSGTPCGVSLGTATYACSSNTIGDNNDGVTVEIPYTGSNATITSVTTTSGGTVNGDPATLADGTITITGLSEGDAWDITLNGGDCDATSASGTVLADQCDPAPNSCFDLSIGTETFELVVVTANSQSDEWTNTAGTYAMNGYVGSGVQEQVETWLVFGPLDMTAVADLTLAFDATKNFTETELVVAYTGVYSGCPSGSTWTTAQTLTTTGSYDVDLSATTGTDVFIGIQYVDDGVDGYSGWELSNVALEAYGSCPTLGTRPISSCAVCEVILQTETYTCATNTEGDNNDSVTINIAYSGSEDTITSVTTTSAGTITGDDPAALADGTIMITGLSEGDAWDLTINGGDCDGTTMSGTVAASQCDPEILVINEIHADPSNAAGDVGDANGDGTAVYNEDEFVEIYNTGVVAIDMEGYTLEDASVRHTFPIGTILQPNSFITVFGGGTPTGVPGLVQVSDTGDLGLSNSGDTVTLRDNNGVVLTMYTYGSEGADNQSIARDPDFTGPFVQHSTIGTAGALFSPGLENDDPSLSNEQFETSTFSIYPNPTNTGFINITSKSNDLLKANVFDILGKQVLESNVVNNQLNVSGLNAGVYIIKLTQNNATVTKKLVIK